MNPDDFQNSVIIKDTKFPVKAYSRSVTDDLVARFGDGAQGQTNLDLTKALTQETFRGGMFQRVFDDPEKVSTITGLYYNETDQKLYLADNFNISSPTGNKGEAVTAWAVHGGKIYYNVFTTQYTGSDVPGNRIYTFDPVTNTTAAITMNATVAASSVPVTSICSHGDFVFYTGKNVSAGNRVIRYDPSANTSTQLAFTDTLRYLASYRGRLYGVGLSALVVASGEFGSTATLTFVKNAVGNNDPDYANTFNLIEFNGALWIPKSDGLFRYDGVDVFPVISDRKSQSPSNFTYSEVFNGALYFTRGKTLWRFDGINLEELQDFSSQGSIIGLSSRDDRLWVTVRNSVFSVGSDKYGGSVTSSTFSVFAYTGVGFFEYKVFSSDNAGYITPMLAVGLDYSVFLLPKVYLNASSEPRHDVIDYGIFKHTNEFSSKTYAQQTAQIYGSEIDCKFPSIPKTLNGVSIETDDFETNIEGLKIYVRANNGLGYEDWQLVYDKGGFRSSVSDTSLFVQDYYLHDQTGLLQTSPVVFKRLQYRVEISNPVADVIPRIRSITFRYTLQPRTRFKWQLTLGIFGTDSDLVDPISDKTSTELRQILLDAHRNKLPILFYDIDWTTVSSVVNVNLTDFTDGNASESQTREIVVAGAPFIAQGEALAVGTKDVYPWFNALVKEVEYNSGSNNTTYELYSVVNGQYGRRESIGGSDDVTVAADMILRRSHAVYITAIPSERFTLDFDTENVISGDHSDYKSEITIVITEV